MKKKTALMIVIILIAQIVLPVLTVVTENCFTVQSNAVYYTDENSIGWKYNIDDNGNAIDVAPTSLSIENLPSDVTIPSTLDGHTVISLDRWAFGGITRLESISIPSTVTKIGYSAFKCCTNLTSINIPNGVTYIDGYAFSGCSSLTNIEIPESVTDIKEFAFEDCTALLSIVIPEGVTNIERDVFGGCSSLESITLPESLTDIANGAFSGCSSLTSIEIPESVTTIGQYAFYYCNSLTNINIPENVTSIGSFAFYECSSLTNIEIPEGITNINGYTFYNCSSLESITLPESLTDIANGAFYRCSSLTSIEIPESVTNIGSFAFQECSSIDNIDIREGVTNIGNGAFNRCTNLTSINIPDGVTSIEGFTFNNCSNLKSINIPEGVISIGEYAFYSCASLTNITIPDGVTSIEYYAFKNCRGPVFYTSNCTAMTEYVNNYPNESYFVCDDNAPTITGVEDEGIYYKEDSLQIIPEISDVLVSSKGNEVDCIKQITLQKDEGELEEYIRGTPITEVGNYRLIATDYVGNTSEIDFSIISKEVTRIEITKEPDKTEYIEGETFNPEGMEVIAYYNNGTSNLIEDYTIDKTEGLTLEDNEIVVSYEGKTAAQPITVVEKELVRIEIIKEPDKVEYVEKTNFVREGMIVKAYYNNNTEEEIEDYEIVNGENLQYLQESITVRYTKNNVTREATQQIAVVKRGDANRDGNVDIRDIFRINKHRLGKSPLTGVLLEASDVTGDGIADFYDILKINKYRLGKIDEV